MANTKKEDITGIILAGGKSSRMGSNKALLKIGEVTLLEHAIGILKPYCSQILISSNETLHVNYNVVQDEIKGIGPVGGIISCLKRSVTDLNLVLSCDMPFVSGKVIEKLLKGQDGLITIPTIDGNYLEPVCAVYKKGASQILEKAIAERNYKLHNIVKNNHCKIIDFSNEPAFDKNTFFNINSRNDFEKAVKILKNI